MSVDTHAVRMGMSVTQGAALGELLQRVPEDVRGQVLDQLWLKTALTGARRQVRVAERHTFDARADRILEQLDPQERAE